MRDVSRKSESLREAVAQAQVKARPESLKAIQEGRVPKGDVREAARLAGIQAAKRTSELVPFCHPVPLDWVEVEVALEPEGLVITTRVRAVWRTGVEMEALTAAAVAALTVYDMLKPLDDTLEITTIRLVEKRGGLSEFRETFPRPLRAAVVVASDSVSAGKKPDKSGKVIVERLQAEGIQVVSLQVLPDDQEALAQALSALADEEKADLILTTGGTGLGPRDVTVEATRAVVEREAPGIAEAMRHYGQDRTPYAMLSRGIAGVRGKTIIVNLPGSSRGAAEALDALFPGLPHALPMLAGGGHSGKKGSR